MDSLTKSERILHGSLYCLTFVTGLVDAGSYVAMGHVFTANMTGNIVFLGFAFGGVAGLSIGRSATALGFALAGGSLAGKLDNSAWETTAQYIACVCLWDRDIASIGRNDGLVVFRTSGRTVHLYGTLRDHCFDRAGNGDAQRYGQTALQCQN